MPKRSIKKTRKLSKGGGRGKVSKQRVKQRVKQYKATKAIKKATKKRKTRGSTKANHGNVNLMKVFIEMKKKGPSTKFSDAFKPAAESYKKGTN